MHLLQEQSSSLGEHSLKFCYRRDRLSNTRLETKFIGQANGFGLSVIGSDDVRIAYSVFDTVMRPQDTIGFKLISDGSHDWIEIACDFSKPA